MRTVDLDNNTLGALRVALEERMGESADYLRAEEGEDLEEIRQFNLLRKLYQTLYDEDVGTWEEYRC